MTEKDNVKEKGGFGYPLLCAVCPDCGVVLKIGDNNDYLNKCS